MRLFGKAGALMVVISDILQRDGGSHGLHLRIVKQFVDFSVSKTSKQDSSRSSGSRSGSPTPLRPRPKFKQ
jgi:hypothetical protein